MQRYVLILALLLSPALGATGCASSGGDDLRYEHQDVPKSFREARAIEDRANKLLEEGNRTRHPGRRREFLSRALDLLKEARLLYENELIDQPGTPEKQQTIEREMERLSDQIALIHKSRPTVE